MLRHFYNDFMAFVPLQLPQLLDVTTMEEPQFYGDYVLLTFPLRTPYELDEVMDMLEQMYGDLCLDLELHSKSGFLKYKKDKSDVLMNFI